MAIPRSSTVPGALSEAEHPKALLARSKSVVDSLPLAYGQPLTSRRALRQPRAGSNVRNVSMSSGERDEPFNLAGFFPRARLMSAREEEVWDWLRPDEEETDEEASVHHAGRGSDPCLDEEQVHKMEDCEPGPACFTRREEDVAEVAIRQEDKLGILSLDALLFGDTDEEDRLYSPYLDEAVDDESLYRCLHARRTATSGVLPAESVPLGELFLQEGWQGAEMPM